MRISSDTELTLTSEQYFPDQRPGPYCVDTFEKNVGEWSYFTGTRAGIPVRLKSILTPDLNEARERDEPGYKTIAIYEDLPVPMTAT